MLSSALAALAIPLDEEAEAKGGATTGWIS
jgi:hypothetical protein